MFFKFVFSALILGSFFSCGLKLGEPVPENNIVELKGTKCLNQSISVLKVFIDGKASDRDVNNSLECISQVLMAFKENINGANRDFFAPEELAYFIEMNFLKGEYSFRPEFLTEIMKLKVVLIGGSSKVFYKKDIEQLSLVIDRLRPELVKLNPEMKIISGDWEHTNISELEKEKKFILAKKNAGHFFEILSNEFARTGQKYEADHFLNLIKQMAIFSKSNVATIDKIEKARPFLIHFKKNLVGQGTEIAPRDWNKITKSLNEMLFQLLRVKYFLKPLAVDEDEKRWVVYERITEDLFQLIATLLEAQKKPVLSNQQVYELISSILPIFSDQTIDEKIVESISDLKNALIGDKVLSENGWSSSDLIRIKTKLPILFSEIRKILSSLKQLGFQSSVPKTVQNFIWKKSYPDFNLLESDFNQSVSIIMNTFDGEYSLDSLQQFLSSLESNKLLVDIQLPKNMESLFKVGSKAKTILTGTETSHLTNSELKHIVKVAAAGYFHYLQYENYIGLYTVSENNFYTGLENILPKISKTVETVLNFKPTHVLTTAELSGLFEVLKNEKIVSVNISEKSFQSVSNILWSNILIEPKHRLAGFKLNGFNSEALNQILSETQIFIQSGHDLFDIFRTDTVLDQKTILFRIQGLIELPSTPAMQGLTLNELRRVVSGPVPMVLDQNQFLKIFESDLSYKLNDLLQAEIARTLSRILIRSFSNDPIKVQKLSGLTLPEAQYFFDSIQSVVWDLDLMDPSNTSFISSRFREANLFVAHANGDDLANFEELSDLVLHIVSGLNRASILREGAVKICLPQQIQPVTGRTAVSEDCLLQHYFDTTAGFESIPRFSELKKQFTRDQNKNYYLSLLKAAGHLPNEQKIVYFDDANLFPHVAQYIEIIFARYDQNKDGVLVKNEALKAFPVFKSTIKDMLKTISGGSVLTEAQLPGVFMYLLKYGRPPKTIAEKIKFLGFIKDDTKWDIESNRMDLGVIFNFIADALAKP